MPIEVGLTPLQTSEGDFVEQLDGDLEIVRDQGTTIRIKSPLDADA